MAVAAELAQQRQPEQQHQVRLGRPSRSACAAYSGRPAGSQPAAAVRVSSAASATSGEADRSARGAGGTPRRPAQPGRHDLLGAGRVPRRREHLGHQRGVEHEEGGGDGPGPTRPIAADRDAKYVARPGRTPSAPISAPTSGAK